MYELYYSKALPHHAVAIDQEGRRWMIPLTPISNRALENKVPYKGNAKLVRMDPVLEGFYQPQEEVPSTGGRKSLGLPPQYDMTVRISHEVHERLVKHCQKTGVGKKACVEEALLQKLWEEGEA